MVEDKAFTRKLGAHIRHLRVQKNWTQEDLADACGIHANFAGTIERGEQTMSLEVARRVAAGLGLKLSELLQEVGE